MKKMMLVLSVAAATSFASPAGAGQPIGVQAGAMRSAPAVAAARYVRVQPGRRARSGRLVSDLMELERRKNAWLRRTFFGR